MGHFSSANLLDMRPLLPKVQDILGGLLPRNRHHAHGVAAAALPRSVAPQPVGQLARSPREQLASGLVRKVVFVSLVVCH